MVSPSVFRFPELLPLPRPDYGDPIPMAFIRGAGQGASRQPSHYNPSVWLETAGNRRFAANCINRYREWHRCTGRSAHRESSNIGDWQRYEPVRVHAVPDVLNDEFRLAHPFCGAAGIPDKISAGVIRTPPLPGGEYPLFTTTGQGLLPCPVKIHW